MLCNIDVLALRNDLPCCSLLRLTYDMTYLLVIAARWVWSRVLLVKDGV